MRVLMFVQKIIPTKLHLSTVTSPKKFLLLMAETVTHTQNFKGKIWNLLLHFESKND